MISSCTIAFLDVAENEQEKQMLHHAWRKIASGAELYINIIVGSAVWHKGCTLILVSNCQRTTMLAGSHTTRPDNGGALVRLVDARTQSCTMHCTLHTANLMTSDDDQCECADRGHGPPNRKS